MRNPCIPVIWCAEWPRGWGELPEEVHCFQLLPEDFLCYSGSRVPLWCSPEARTARLHYSGTQSVTLQCNYSISSSSVSKPQEPYIITINISIQIPQRCGLWSFLTKPCVHFELSIFWTDFLRSFPVWLAGLGVHLFSHLLYDNFKAQRIEYTADWQQIQHLLSCRKNTTLYIFFFF